jgi:hypothetical protein
MQLLENERSCGTHVSVWLNSSRLGLDHRAVKNCERPCLAYQSPECSVKDDRLTYDTLDYETKDTDVLAIFRVTPSKYELTKP